MIDAAVDLIAPVAVNGPKAAALQYVLAPAYVQVRPAAAAAATALLLEN